jgi:hypothetical protein
MLGFFPDCPGIVIDADDDCAVVVVVLSHDKPIADAAIKSDLDIVFPLM